MTKEKIAIGNDHAGFGLKTEVLELLKEKGYEYEDFGSYDTNSVDYPVIAKKVSDAVVSKSFDLGILICGTGIGMDICANKIKGIRASLCTDTFSAHSAREHNDANVLCLGARVTGPELAKEIINVWLNAKFKGGRHQRRVEMFE